MLFTVLLYSLFSPGTPLLGQINGVSPVSNHLWEPAASSRLVGVPPTRREITPRLGPSVRRWDLDAFRHVEGSVKAGQPSDPEGKGPVVPTWNNSGLHRSPPLAPVATAVSVWGASTTHLAAAFRLRHDASAFSLLGACIQDSSQARYRQGWALWKEFIRLYFCTSDVHFPRGCGTSVCGDGFCPQSLYEPAALLVVCRPDVESRQSLLQGPWSVFRRTPVSGGVGRQASGPT